MRRFVRGVTLTPEERILVGLKSPGQANTSTHRSSTGVIHSHSCSVTLPDGTTCETHYTRYQPRAHRFEYAAPVCQRVWMTDRMESDTHAIEQKAQELAAQAFRQAQAEEQKQMRRKTPLPGRPKPTSEPQMKPKTAALCAGKYAVCLYFASGRLIPLGPAYECMDEPLRALREGVHSAVHLCNGQRLVIGICNRLERRWQETRFPALPNIATPSPDVSSDEKPTSEDTSSEGPSS